jgi:hypothetical protein
MSRWRSMIPLAIACLLPLAACKTGSGDSAPRAEGPACVKACDEAMDACSVECSNQVDDLLCSKSCLDKLETCKRGCE